MQESSRERLAEHRILSGDRQVAGQGDVTGETVGTALDDADRREAQVMDGDDDVADNVTRIGDLFVTNWVCLLSDDDEIPCRTGTFE